MRKSAETILLGLGLLILERIEEMNDKLAAAIADLNTEVEDESTKLASIKTYVQGVPALIASAVADALTAAGVEEAAAADQIEAARTAAQTSVDDTLSAISANTSATDTGGGATGGTSATDLGGGGEQTPPGEGTIGTASGPIATPDNPPPAPDQTTTGDGTDGTAASGEGLGLDGADAGATGGADAGTTGGADAGAGAPVDGTTADQPPPGE